MKLLIFCIALLFAAGCGGGQIETSNGVNYNANSSVQGNAVSGNLDTGISTPIEADKVDEAKLKELDEQNEKFRAVPDEFRKIDFKNFQYPLVRLKNGEYDDRDPRYVGGTNYGMEDVFYLDLTGDEGKEAVVFLYAVQCGGSCDGGRSFIYFYTSQKGKPKLIGEIYTGSAAGGCSIKSFSIKAKKIYIEQLGRCVKKTDIDENENYSCKFCAKDLTNSVYSFKNLRLVKESSNVTETDETNFINDKTEISVGD